MKLMSDTIIEEMVDFLENRSDLYYFREDDFDNGAYMAYTEALHHLKELIENNGKAIRTEDTM